MNLIKPEVVEVIILEDFVAVVEAEILMSQITIVLTKVFRLLNRTDIQDHPAKATTIKGRITKIAD